MADPSPQQNALRALALLTAWNAEPSNISVAEAVRAVMANAQPSSTAELAAAIEDLTGLLAGAVSLAGILLVQLEGSTGRPAPELLQRLALALEAGPPDGPLGNP